MMRRDEDYALRMAQVSRWRVRETGYHGKHEADK